MNDILNDDLAIHEAVEAAKAHFAKQAEEAIVPTVTGTVQDVEFAEEPTVH